MSTRTAVSLALATAFAGARSDAIAHANPLDAIINTVNKDRPARCPALRYDRGV